MALIGCVAIIATNTLLRPLGRFVNGRQRNSGASLQQAGDEDDEPTDHMLEVVTTDKSELSGLCSGRPSTGRSTHSARSTYARKEFADQGPGGCIGTACR
jgi:hypothetical protein